MDSFTHLALGVCAGELFFEKGFGKKAMFWGALAQSIPDIDFVAHFWMDVPSAMLAHRGFTHSLLFLILATPLFSLFAEKVHRPHNISFSKWCVFFFSAISLHLFLDAFNNYGVGWFEPFSHKRIAFNLIYVADPFFSITPIFSCTLLIIRHAHHQSRKALSLAGLIFPLFYLSYCGINKYLLKEKINDYLKLKMNKGYEVYSTPAPLQSWMWFVIVKVPDGFLTTYVSVFGNPEHFKFKYRRKNADLLSNVDNHEILQKLIRFSDGYYTIDTTKGSIVLNDLRFGQIQGWQDSNSSFVFHYGLNHTSKDDELIVQRGRLSGWTTASIMTYFKKIKGN